MSRRVWELARRQHGVVSLAQLLSLGYTRHAIEHRRQRGRLHHVHRGVYAVGRRELTREGEWMAAVLACGAGAVLSGDSAAALWEIRARKRAPVEIAVPGVNRSSPKGIRIRRCRHLPGEDRTTHHRIPVTTPIRTLIDLAARLDTDALEAAINEADNQDSIDPADVEATLRSVAARLRAAP